MEVGLDLQSPTVIQFGDLEVVAKAVMPRLNDPVVEAMQVERMRELLRAASELVRVLSMHTQLRSSIAAERMGLRISQKTRARCTVRSISTPNR